jgi:dimethylhistidine N-methyltransferase
VGARLFEAICELEEYYPTRTESGILNQNIGEIAAWVGPSCKLVELGSGSSTKTRLLLEHLDHPSSYVPVDVSREQLLECSRRIAQDYPEIEVMPICADYTGDFELPAWRGNASRTVFFFPGSTIGNFEPEDAKHFLSRLFAMCGGDGAMLLGVDLRKDPRVLNPAYNDSQGITADFNLNLLCRINRELGGDFDVSQFRHHAFYNEEADRIEMHLISRKPQTVTICGQEFSFELGESILTEHSYKYGPEGFQQLAARAGWDVAKCWVDENQLFSVQFLVPRSREN